MITDPIRMCELLVGLPDVNVLAVEDTIPLKVHIEVRNPSRSCPDCGERGEWKERRRVELVDLASFGRPARLVWHKHQVDVWKRRLPTGDMDQPGSGDRRSQVGDV